MSECRECGKEIAFRRLPSGKSYPVNPDGSPHWDACKAAQRAAKPLASKPAILTAGKHTVFYQSETVPPWDESLGAYTCLEGCCPCRQPSAG